MKLTRIDLNSWILQIADQTVLIDPWLVDPLVFYGIPWLFTAYHTTPSVYTPATLPETLRLKPRPSGRLLFKGSNEFSNNIIQATLFPFGIVYEQFILFI